MMMAQSRAEYTWEINNYGRFINQFSPNIKNQYGNTKGSTKTNK